MNSLQNSKYIRTKMILNKILYLYIMKNKKHFTNYLLSYILFRKSLFALTFQVLVVYVAYKCNKSSKVNNKYLNALLAFFFPDIYIMQAFIRKFFLDDYKC